MGITESIVTNAMRLDEVTKGVSTEKKQTNKQKNQGLSALGSSTNQGNEEPAKETVASEPGANQQVQGKFTRSCFILSTNNSKRNTTKSNQVQRRCFHGKLLPSSPGV